MVSVGRGIGSKENIAIEELAKEIGAEIACRPPVAEMKMDGV